MKNAILLFHQGWTDILNCMPLINHYSRHYKKIFLYIREDSTELVDFFCKQIINVEIFYVQKNLINKHFFINSLQEKHFDSDLLIHGEFDRFRIDKFKNAFSRNSNDHFAVRFYKNYNLNRNLLNSRLSFARDQALENKVYDEFTKEHGFDYVLKHSSKEKEITISSPFKTVELGGLTTNPFHYLKVLEEAKEIHVIDSMWAILCFLMEEKEKMFLKNDKKIVLYYLNRPGGLLPNDNVVSNYHNWRVECN